MARERRKRTLFLKARAEDSPEESCGCFSLLCPPDLGAGKAGGKCVHPSSGEPKGVPRAKEAPKAESKTTC